MPEAARRTEAGAAPLVAVRGLARYFDVSRPLLNRVIEGGHRQILKAVDGVSS